jgi:hypothetical protein
VIKHAVQNCTASPTCGVGMTLLYISMKGSLNHIDINDALGLQRGHQAIFRMINQEMKQSS